MAEGGFHARNRTPPTRAPAVASRPTPQPVVAIGVIGTGMPLQVSTWRPSVSPTALTCTLLGLCFALVVTRTDFRWKRSLRALTLLPIITPPFVIGLALILLLGRNGALTQFVASWLGIPPGRWVYGFFGVWLSQVLAYTPIAFMVLIGVVEGVSPSVEEASQTLGASRWQTMRRVSLAM